MVAPRTNPQTRRPVAAGKGPLGRRGAPFRSGVLVPWAATLALLSCQGSGDAAGSSGGSGGGDTEAGGTTSGGSSSGGASAGGAASGGASSGGSERGGDSSGGIGGETPNGGSGGAGGATPDVCDFTVSGTLSEHIPTVGVVDWSSTLPGVTEARIEFSLDDPQPDEVNRASGGLISASDSRALLLGLKPNRPYTYRIIVTAGDVVCVSEDQSLLSGDNEGAPAPLRMLGEAADTRAPGYIVACSYSGISGAMILDTDGAIVWWTTDAPNQCSQAHMDWAGESMWMLKAQPGGAGTSGDVRRMPMDGGTPEVIAGLEGAHHDFAVLPNGAAAFLVWTNTGDGSSDLVERAGDGSLRTVLRFDETAYPVPTSTQYHANAVRYREADNTLTVSDLYVGTISRLTRDGEIQWQMRGSCDEAEPSKCFEVPYAGGNHGHQVLENGNLLVFYTQANEPSPVHEYSIAENGGGLSGSEEWAYLAENGSLILGDVQRLPHGNTQITYSADGIIQEVTPDKRLVYSLQREGSWFWGYTRYRQTLYGPPPQ